MGSSAFKSQRHFLLNLSCCIRLQIGFRNVLVFKPLLGDKMKLECAWPKIVKEVENLRYIHPWPFRIRIAKLMYEVNPDQSTVSMAKRQNQKSYWFLSNFNFPVRALDTHGGVSCIVNSTADGRLRINKSVPPRFFYFTKVQSKLLKFR